MKDIALCLLTWNEVEGCRQSVPQIPRSIFSEIFAVDANSSDGTVQALEEMGVTVVPQATVGYNAAYLEALRYFTADAIVFFHPKGTIDERDLLTMTSLLQKEFDFVVGSRMVRGASNEEDIKFIRHRKWFGQLLALAAWIRWGQFQRPKVTDPLHGFRGFSRSFARTLELEVSGVTADLEMVRHAYLKSATRCEFPVRESPRSEGETHFPAWSTGKALIAFLFRRR